MRLFVLASAFVLSALSPLAHASTIVGSGGGFSGSGTLTTVNNGDGSYTITAISGAASGIEYLLSPGSFHGNNNQLYPTAASIVDAQGFAFQDTQGNTSYMVDIFQDATSSTGYTAAFLDSDSFAGSVDVTLSLTAPATSFSTVFFVPNAATVTYNFSFTPAVATSPEPSTLLLLGSGLLPAIKAVRRRVFRKPKR